MNSSAHYKTTSKSQMKFKVARFGFWVVLFAALIFTSYSFVFEVTKVSFLASLPLVDKLSVLSGMFALTVVVALLAFTVSSLLSGISGKLEWTQNAASLVAYVILVVTLITIGENWSYTLFGVGLKVGDSFALKLTFLIISALGAKLLLSPLSALAYRATNLGIIPLCALSAVAIGYLIFLTMAPSAAAKVSSQDVKHKFNVLILSSDGLDASSMGIYGYSADTTPFLSKHSDEFTIYTNAYTNNGNTTGSIVSLLNGISPLTTGVVYPPDSLDTNFAERTLPHLLGQLGYYRANLAVPHFADARDQNLTNAFDENNGEDERYRNLTTNYLGDGPLGQFVLHTVGYAVELMMDATFIKEYDNPMDQIEGTSSTLTDVDRIEAIKRIARHHRPFFINTHFMGSHGPMFNPSSRVASANLKQERPWQKEFYEDSIRDFDNTIEAAYTFLTKQGILNDTFIVITSDHGQGYNAHKRIPLMVRFPSVSPGVVAQSVQRIDIAPTILSVLGVQKPNWMEGDSLLEVQSLGQSRMIFSANVVSSRNSKSGWVRSSETNNGRNLITGIVCNRYAVFGGSDKFSSGVLDAPNPPCKLTELEAQTMLTSALKLRIENTKNVVGLAW
ncbi:Arylsulfatase A [Phyllobacterium sp. CL33Tsu]|uniref:sulfatase-like hydrolase/transferase n=1 Tax=Phyllobacterium sp. CL33Tsu TaxID=1798191 RepID=UPI0008F169ED|nr:sulfatase-like hydrolase/transferase [Phyllobacterium sp. CL33Tsu]SFJ55513.1 Arylsulfatase A [Phyllobacterium sp. CL33Tsu]